MDHLVKPEVYDELHRQEQFYKYGFIVGKTIDLRGDVIDIGCGTGLLYEYIKQLQIESRYRYICLDPDEEMLHIAAGKTTSPLVLIIEAHGEELPVRSEYFDFALSISTWGVFENKVNALREMKRVIRERGLVVVSGYPRTYTTTPLDVDEEFRYMGRYIDDFYIYIKLNNVRENTSR